MDDISLLTAPPIGSAQAGDLYVDLQSRTLWLGVDVTVDPATFVLISDIVGLQSQITSGDTAQHAYTDSQVALKANIASPIFTGDPKAPTPATADNDTSIATTAYVKANLAALGSSSFTTGMIMMYSGSLANIGVGALAGWVLCDGANGTPNLRDKFIIGAGNKPVGEVNPLATVNTGLGGAHTHAITGTAITIAQMPTHGHGGGTGYQNVDHTHAININSGTESAAHTHSLEMNTHDGAGTGFARGGGTPVEFYQQTLGESATHYHNVNGNTGGMSASHNHALNYEGGSATHTHTESAAADHQHALTSTQVRDVLPYYALAYIMKT